MLFPGHQSQSEGRSRRDQVGVQRDEAPVTERLQQRVSSQRRAATSGRRRRHAVNTVLRHAVKTVLYAIDHRVTGDTDN